MEIFEKPLELVILDVDGTINQLFPYAWDNMERVVKSLGLPIEPYTKYQYAVTNGNRQFLPTFSLLVNELWPEVGADKICEVRERMIEEECINPYPISDGALEAIKIFLDQGVKLAICTTNDNNTLSRKLAHVGVDLSWFHSIIASDLHGKPKKPDPHAVRYILTETSIDRERAIYVGDWIPDMECSQGAGVRFIPVLTGLVPREFFARHVPANHILEKLGDITKLVKY